MSIESIDAMVEVLRRLKRETLQMRKRSAKLNDQAGANACAIEIRRIKHEAHCLAVELGIADVRAEAAYGTATAPAGMGREFLLERQAPQTKT